MEPFDRKLSFMATPGARRREVAALGLDVVRTVRDDCPDVARARRRTMASVSGREVERVFGKKERSASGDPAVEAGPTVDGTVPPGGSSQEPLPIQLLWLADAPMFIDEHQVEAFYDAVLRPDYEGATLTLSNDLKEERSIGGTATVGSAFPWLKAEATGNLSRTRTQEAGQEATLTRISNPFRHLLALAMHYATEQTDRLVICKPGSQESAKELADRLDDAFIQRSPRALLLLDLPEGTKLIPAALELTDGTVRPLYDEFAEACAEEGETAPSYPKAPSTKAQRDEYWKWFSEHYSDRAALNTVEAAVNNGTRIEWIDFRVPLGLDGPPYMHLHIAARGNFATGIFAYNLINRGYKHGLRLVGTLKSEPDLNVLAVFER